MLLLQSSAPMTRYGQELLHEPLVLVGTCYYDWEDEMCPYVLEKLCDNLSAENLLGAAEKIRGNSGLEKTGHIIALAAKIIRETEPKKMNYGGRLASLAGGQIVVELKV